MARDGMDATLATLLSQTLQPKKEFAAGGRVCSKHPNKFGQHQTARAAKDGRRTERDCEHKSCLE